MKFIAYYRVSTQQQGRSGLGLDSQQSIVNEYVVRQDGIILQEYTEIESGQKNNRPKLLEALNHCKLTNSILVVSKLDRLSRDLHFLTTVMKSNIQFICCDQPNSGTLILHVLAAVAEEERRAISHRTKMALIEAKKRGKILGNPILSEVRNSCTVNAREQWQKNNEEFNKAIIPIIRNLQQKSITSHTKIASELNLLGFKTRYGRQFHSATIRNILLKSGFKI